MLALLLGALFLLPATAEAQAPSNPTNFQVEVTAVGAYTATWTRSASADSYRVDQQSVCAGNFQTATVSGGATETFSGSSLFGTWCLRVRACASGSCSTGTQWVNVNMGQVGTYPPPPATLSGLTASTHTSATGTFTALTLEPSTFASDTTSYTATVANTQTHLKLTPTVTHSSATVKVGKQGTTLATVTSGSASTAIELSVGTNAITVEVTAADTTKTYTVTVTRQTQQQTALGQVWSATLTPVATSGGIGCGSKSECDAQLDDNSFTAGGQSYHFLDISLRNNGNLFASLSPVTNSALQALKFCVGSTAFDFSNASTSTEIWLNSGLTWTVGTPVSLSIGTSCPQQTQSTDATLSGLTATSSTSASGSFTTLSIGTFSASTTTYTATVANSITHVKITPTVNDSGATVTVAGTTVTSGSASGAIALSVGSNALAVVVTAQDGTTTQTYTVTITRAAAQSSDANLSGLTASSAMSSGGTFTTLTLTPAFSASTTSYTASVANSVTHVKLRPTVSHASATVTVSGTTVTSGSDSDAIALSVGSNNAITVRVTAQDTTTTKDYTVTITRQEAQQTTTPAAPTNLMVNPGNAKLDLSWTAPSGTLTGYDVHYTSANAGTVADSAAASGSNAATAWVAVNRTGTTASQTISSLANGTTYRVRVRATNANGDGAWVFGSGTPSLPTVSLSAPSRVVEGSPVTVTARLSTALSSAVTIPVTVSTALPNTAESGDVDGTTSINITISAGQTTGTGTIQTNQDPGANDETFTVSLGTLPQSVTAGSPSSVTVTIRDDEGFIRVSLSKTTVRVNEGRRFSLGLVFSDQPHETHGLIPLVSEDRCTRPRYHERVTGLSFVRRTGFTQSIKNIRTGNVSEDTTCTIRIDEARLPDDYAVGAVGTVTITIVDIPDTRDDEDDPPPEDRQSPPDTGGSTPGGTPGGGGGTPSGGGGGTPSGGGGGTPSGGGGGDSPLPDDCGDNDRETLVSFYDATDGDNWDDNTDWKSEKPLDLWYGVDTDEDGEVLSLRLADNNLSGDMPTEELLCLNEDTDTELKELALWDNDGLSGEEPDELALAVERAALRDVAVALSLNTQWFDDYEDPFSFSDWHGGVTTDDDGRVTELDFTGEDITGVIPQSVFVLEKLTAINTGCKVTVDPVPERVRVTMPEGCSDASLRNIDISPGELEFDPMDLSYEVPVGYGPESVTVTPTASESEAVITVNGEDAVSGEDVEIELNEEEPTIVSIVVTAPDGMTTRTYEITVTRCGEDDIWALSRFYEAVGGQNWNDNTNWNSQEPLDRWFGVGTDEDGRVISLRLEDNGLSGEIPRELVCLSELKELALWDNDSLSGKVPEELALAVERAVLRDVAEALSLNPGWFDDYGDPFNFEDWHEGVTTDDDERVTELDFTGEDITGEIPGSVFELKRLTAIETGCEVTLEIEAPGRVSVMRADDCVDESPTSGGGGCAVGQGDFSVSGFGLFLVTLVVFAALGRKNAFNGRKKMRLN